MIIAIDGPAGSGKSTVARRVASELGFHYLDTGAMYRAVSVLARRKGVALTDDDGLSRLAAANPVSFRVPEDESGTELVFISEIDVTEAIRTPMADSDVSAIAKIPGVRSALVTRQREIGRARDSVVEGRDIGSVVFPDAQVKVYLTASPEERARRRHEERGEQGTADVRATLDSIVERDRVDSTRSTAPLTVAEGSHVIDTSELSIEQVVGEIAALARDAGSRT